MKTQNDRTLDQKILAIHEVLNIQRCIHLEVTR